jgi:hypothetical protein
MVYLQRKPVAYANYHIGLYYVLPFDLRDENGKAIIDLDPEPPPQPKKAPGKIETFAATVMDCLLDHETPVASTCLESL